MKKLTSLTDVNNLTKEEVLSDYRIANESRQASLLGRREVLTGKAKFGIFGDGKEIPQLAMARAFKNGDWRSGYYRDQTFMLATGMMTLEEVFSQLYGDTDPNANRANGGRLMNNHFATRSLDENGNWLNLVVQKNSSADSSPTASQMPRLLGLALASKQFKQNKELNEFKDFSNKGNEVAFGTIGDASTSEGHFFETINAAGVMQVPMAISIWDDGWGISVPNKQQTTKSNISEILSGFEKLKGTNGFYIFRGKCYDYASLVDLYSQGIALCRKEHTPVLFHIRECTQPQGHSTSGSHERYKTKEQLIHEKEIDCIVKMRQWIINEAIASESELDEIENEATKRARQARKNAWNNYLKPIISKKEEFLNLVDITTCNCTEKSEIEAIKQELIKIGEPIYKDIISSAKKILRLICDSCSNPHNSLKINVTNWLKKEMDINERRYSSHLYSESKLSALNITSIEPVYSNDSKYVPGREILRDNFDYIFIDWFTNFY
ncbi:MAG TPA: thiamine pyrophosphate-dependent dehydrogenase E1 component subunit alpha [Bacteroidales bacterium]|nr:thiamine pyrophosphate-dependent dehydrogenase E1 component subunit alpha [Bacteroidales bacterium]